MSTDHNTIDQDAAKRFAMVREYLKNKLGKMLQSDIGEVCGLTQGMIGHIENGRREIPYQVLKALYIKYNISPTYIVAGEGSIEYKKEDRTLITDTISLRAEIEVLRAELQKVKQDIRILSQTNKAKTNENSY